MKVKNIKLGIRSLDTAFSEWAETFEKVRKGRKVDKRGGDQDLTEKRLELLHVIKEQEPNSVYELAKILKRDIKNVNDDIELLKNIALVSITKAREGRGRVIPRVNYDKIQLEIGV